VPKRDETQLARQDLIDTIRTVTGLEARIALRRRRNELESEAIEEFDRRVARGEAFQVAARDTALKALEA
jgi:hypothetical protein